MIRIAPTFQTKLEILAKAATHDLACACGPSGSRQRGDNGQWIYPAALPSGERVPMLKVLQSSGCERNCIYCVQRAGGQERPLTLDAEELARGFAELYRARRVFGLFLSSAIRGGPIATMDRILATAEILRLRHRYRGYLHLKLIPGCRPDQIDRAMDLATRVSINLEAPTARCLASIAPSKDLHRDILAPMRQVARAEAAGRFARAGQTSQLVVGAAGESDQQIAKAIAWMYGELKMARIYYSALQPVAGTPVEGRLPVPFMREHRLYEVDFLLRTYGFRLDEIVFDEHGALPLDINPKAAWADLHPERFPVEINTAAVSELVRIPGIGPRSAKRLVAIRRHHPVRNLEALRAAGASFQVAAPYVLLDGKRPPRQLSLFNKL